MVSGFLRPISKDYLQNLLEIILNLLVSLGLRHDNVPLDDIVFSLADEHEVPRTVTLQLLAWFGELDESGGKWKMNTESILKEVGIGLLRHHRVCWFYVHFTFSLIWVVSMILSQKQRSWPSGKILLEIHSRLQLTLTSYLYAICLSQISLTFILITYRGVIWSRFLIIPII